MTQLQQLTELLIQFRDDRNWQQFHDSKNLALALSIEAAELNELFLWKNGADIEKVDRQKLAEELADVFAYALLLAHKHDLDVEKIISEKIRINGEKYPIDKSKGSSRKYTEL
ncbi:MAG: nucleotide pyrophosphohydrolase [Bacteroidetes bacterium]|nr:nucleotide pyrophosphohydrolase [Bacteroidota bacterium]